MAQLPPGAVPAFLGLILLVAVLIEPYVVAEARARPALGAADAGGRCRRSFEGGDRHRAAAQTKGTKAQSRGVGAKGWRAFFARRDAAAIMLAVVLWLVGLYLRPDFWGALDNSFNLLLAFTEIALARHRPDLRHRQWRHRPLGRLGAGAVGRDRRLPDEASTASTRSTPSSSRSSPARSPASSTAPHRALRPAGLRRDARHVLHRARPRRLARRRAPALRLSRELQPARPQAHRDPALFGHGAGRRARSLDLASAVSACRP